MKTCLGTNRHNRFFRTPWGYLILTGLLALSVVCALRYGSAEMSTKAFFAALFGGGERTDRIILQSIRAPRVLAGLLAGVGMSASGVLLQGVTDNGLASPNVIGVNAGAGFGVVLGLLLLPATVVFSFTPVMAFLGAFLTSLLVVAISHRAGGGRSSVVLAGVAVTALLNALISAATLLDTDLLTSYNAFSIGGFSGVGYRELLLPAIMIGVCLLLALVLGTRMDLLSLGTGMASVMGVRVRALRLIAVLCASALSGAVVSFAGLLGFVGLIVPHMARALVGNHTRHLLAASALLGGTVTVTADLLGRVLLSPTEIPVGIMMALVGAPFFLFLLFRRGGGVR